MKCKKCHSEFSSRVKIDGKIRNLSSRKYCLECSPFGKHNTLTLEHNVNQSSKTCFMCGENLPISSYYSNGKNSHSYCKECNKSYVYKKSIEFKNQCVNYKGGKCKVCGYNKCLTALEFHHRDPSKKDFNLSKYKNRRYHLHQQEIEEELDKCDLLCANCHREAHEMESAHRESNSDGRD